MRADKRRPKTSFTPLSRTKMIWTGAKSPRQITEAFPWAQAPRYLIRDRDRVYDAAVTTDYGPWASATRPLPQARLGRTHRGRFWADFTIIVEANFRYRHRRPETQRQI